MVKLTFHLLEQFTCQRKILPACQLSVSDGEQFEPRGDRSWPLDCSGLEYPRDAQGARSVLCRTRLSRLLHNIHYLS